MANKHKLPEGPLGKRIRRLEQLATDKTTSVDRLHLALRKVGTVAKEQGGLYAYLSPQACARLQQLNKAQ